MLRGRLAGLCRGVRLRVALKLEDGPRNLGELVAELVDQHLFALRHRTELLLDELHARNQAVFNGFDGDAHVLER